MLNVWLKACFDDILTLEMPLLLQCNVIICTYTHCSYEMKKDNILNDLKIEQLTLLIFLFQHLFLLRLDLIFWHEFRIYQNENVEKIHFCHNIHIKKRILPLKVPFWVCCMSMLWTSMSTKQWRLFFGDFKNSQRKLSCFYELTKAMLHDLMTSRCALRTSSMPKQWGRLTIKNCSISKVKRWKQFFQL